MDKNLELKVKEQLSNAIAELDHNKVAWIFKWQIIDLQRKAEILLESVTRFEAEEKETVVQATIEFLAEIEPVIQKINSNCTSVR
jgi:hypothetical protein